jgi:2-oxoisovalerate dehydrogenase E2 component (dihydrolipoyl transacylase)
VPAFLLPDLGEGLTEAEIVTWRVQAGDVVAVDQTVVEVETAKAVVEVPVPFAGRVTALHGQPGDVLAVGTPLLTVTSASASPGPASADEHSSADRESGAASESGESSPDGESGQVLIGYGTSGRRPQGRVRARRAPAPYPAGPPAPPPAAHGPVAVVSPLVRRLARDAGLDLAAIRGSGRDGLITRRDVDAAIAVASAPGQRAGGRPAEPGPSPAGTGHSPAGPGHSPAGPDRSPRPGTPPIPAAGSAEPVRIPIRGARKTAADKLSRSRREIPEATVWVDVDATELVALRTALNADESMPRISLLAMVSRYAILGLHHYPELNGRIEGDEIVVGGPVHLGFAAQTGRGLVVPVLPDAQACTLGQLSASLADRTRRARDGQLGPGELTGGTFTINNYGVFGVDGSAAIINHPEVAILGIGRILERPWVRGGQVVARQVTQLTLAFDHRVCDGGTAGGFLRFVADCVESPARALRDM